ncbi:WXG100 family type VII secretion target [Amycolatopsis sp. GM8]|uniref:WXG100 family type VII secretion target n=1 Tax=Amycolatopsis sp. GM8 TaxID=2896530 RepID=UPI001F3D8D41|nr:WXG100 family type VII secretion target [Amycolatopsis sp. GM8]
MSNPLVAPVQSSTGSFTGADLMEDVASTAQAIQSGDWAAGVMGLVGAAMDVVGAALDPFGAIFSAGVGWLMEHVGPLKEALDALAGNPDEIQAHAQTWQNISAELGKISQDLNQAITSDVASWRGAGADAYRARGGDVANLIAAAQAAAAGAASGVGTSGEVVSAVRSTVREIIADLVGHLVSWALQVLFTLGIGLIWVVPQVVRAVASTAIKIAGLTQKLVQALGKLMPMLSKLGRSFDDAAKRLNDIKPSKVDTPRGLPSEDSSTTASSSRSWASKPSGTTTPSADNSKSLTGQIETAGPMGRNGEPPAAVTTTFEPGQVVFKPLLDRNGEVVGICFPTKRGDVDEAARWLGKPNRTSDSTYVHDFRPGADYTSAPTKPSPWAGQKPFYIYGHANPDEYAVAVRRPGGGTDINTIDGATHGKLVSDNYFFQQASRANPHRPVVYTSCLSGHPDGTAAADSAAAVHVGGHKGTAYAPTGTVYSISKNDSSYYGVEPAVDGQGNTVAGEFRPYPKPGGSDSSWMRWLRSLPGGRS